MRAFVLLSVANAAPVIVAQISNGGRALPLDFGWVLGDGERLLGSDKTWRGLVSAAIACAAVGMLFDVSPGIGAGFACASLLGDASHAAIVSRELGLPAVVGTGNATDLLHDEHEIAVSCAEGEEGFV